MYAVIERPGLQDFPEIFPLLKQLWPDKEFSEEKLNGIFEKGLYNSHQAYLVAKYEGKIVGFVSLVIKDSLWDEGKLGHINELVVDRFHRNKGIGKDLLEEIIKVAKEKSCKRVELDSAFRRKEAHLFYKSQGFEKCNFLFSKKI